ncbi:conserved hypothetical protein [Neospora caninum Liverpool]|uniref:Uncharacterized protein n=1 Tax=Neospora caninum (strain Liverpool) TaxID=572307 RepID=F0V969_NEOCL|nr:conserved hypothetical protein [Neospora caninum Liverpool]CBZ50294.1 conserved hypothetical protein [Neospora caninum Liverpool]|eukprot:XP_003880328.1 conserved hypothetical protein [Neospora caninum Liverpool]
MSHVPGIEAPTSPKGSNHHGAETPPSASVDRRPVTPTLPAPVSSRLSPYSLVDRGPPASRLRASASALSSASAEGTSVDGKRPDGASPSLKNELLQSFAHMLLAMRSQRVAFGWQLSQVQRLVEQLAELPPAEGSLPSALPSSVVASLTGGDETLVTTHAEGTNETPLVAASAGTPCPATAGVRVEERAKQLHAGQPLPNAVTTIDMKRGVPHGNEPRKGESAGAANQEKPLALDASRGTGSDPKGRFFPGIPDGNSRLLAGSDVRTSVGPSTTRDEGSSFTASQLDPFSLFSSVPSSSRLELGVANLFHPGAVVSPQSRTSVEGAFADSSETLRREGIGSLLRSRQANGNDDALPEGKSISVTSLTDESAPVPQSVPFTASETGSAHGLAGPSVSLRRGSADLQSLERRIHGIRRAIELGMQFEDAYEMLTARRSPANSSEGGRLILDQAAREQRESPRHSINASKAVQAHAQDSVTASGVATRDSASVAGSETSRPLGLDDLTVVVTPARDSHKRRISSRIDAQLIAEESGKPPFQPSSHTPGAHWEGEETILAHPSVDRDRRSDTRKDAQRAAETARAHRRLQLDQPTVLREVLERRQRTLVRSERIRHLQSQMRVLETAREQMLAHERQMKARDSVGRRTDPEASRQAGQTSEASSGNACVMSSPSVAHVAHEQKPYEKREWAPNTGVAITPTGSLPLTRRRVQHPDERLLPPPQGESPSKGSPSDTVSDVPGGCPRFARGHTRARSQHTGTKGLLLYPTRFLADMMRDSVYELRHPRSPTDRATPLSRRLASQRPARVEQPPERHQGTPRSVSPDASLLSGILDTHPGSRSPNPNQFGSYRSDTYAGVPEALTHEWRAGSSRCRGAKSPAFIRSRESDRSEEDSRPPAGMPSPLRRGRFPGPPPPLRQIAGSATPARIVTRPPFGSDFNAAWMNERLFTSGDFYDYVPSQTNKTNSRGRSPSGQQHSRGVQVSWETDDVHAEDERDDFPVTEVDCYEGGSASIGVSWGGRIGAARDSRGKTQGVRETRESVGRLFSTQDRDVGDTQRVLTLPPPLTVRRLDPTTHKQFFERGQKYLNKLSLELPQDRTLMAVVSEGDVPVAVVRVRLTDDDSDPRAQ